MARCILFAFLVLAASADPLPASCDAATGCADDEIALLQTNLQANIWKQKPIEKHISAHSEHVSANIDGQLKDMFKKGLTLQGVLFDESAKQFPHDSNFYMYFDSNEGGQWKKKFDVVSEEGIDGSQPSPFTFKVLSLPSEQGGLVVADQKHGLSTWGYDEEGVLQAELWELPTTADGAMKKIGLVSISQQHFTRTVQFKEGLELKASVVGGDNANTGEMTHYQMHFDSADGGTWTKDFDDGTSSGVKGNGGRGSTTSQRFTVGINAHYDDGSHTGFYIADHKHSFRGELTRDNIGFLNAHVMDLEADGGAKQIGLGWISDTGFFP